MKHESTNIIPDAELEKVSGGVEANNSKAVKGLEPRKPAPVPPINIDISNIGDPEPFNIDPVSFPELPRVK